MSNNIQELLTAAMNVMNLFGQDPEDVECEEIPMTLKVPKALMVLIEASVSSAGQEITPEQKESVLQHMALQGILASLTSQMGGAQTVKQEVEKPKDGIAELLEKSGLGGFEKQFGQLNKLVEQLDGLQNKLESLDGDK